MTIFGPALELKLLPTGTYVFMALLKKWKTTITPRETHVQGFNRLKYQQNHFKWRVL